MFYAYILLIIGDHCDEDIDECISNNMHCPSNEICVNTPGSAECQCQNGFTRQNGICTGK